jgi:hypothetical protein
MDADHEKFFKMATEALRDWRASFGDNLWVLAGLFWGAGLIFLLALARHLRPLRKPDKTPPVSPLPEKSSDKGLA